MDIRAKYVPPGGYIGRDIEVYCMDEAACTDVAKAMKESERFRHVRIVETKEVERQV